MTHSAQLLKSARLDLIQVHNLLDLDTHLKTLREWRESGRVRYLGVTHYTVSAQPQLVRVLKREKLDFVQFNYSPVTRDAEKELLPLAAERGVAVLVNRPFEDGALFQAVRGQPLPPWAGARGRGGGPPPGGRPRRPPARGRGGAAAPPRRSTSTTAAATTGSRVRLLCATRA